MRSVACFCAAGSILYLDLSGAPDLVLFDLVLERMSPITEAISAICSVPMPSVVTAAVPSRRPLVYQGPLTSNGIGLRFRVMPH